MNSPLPLALIRKTVSIDIKQGKSNFYSFSELIDTSEHVAISFPEALVKLATVGGVPLVRVHSECLTGDVFGSARCDCGDQLNDGLNRISLEGGVLIYLRQEGRGIGLYHKIDAYDLQDKGHDTFAANQLLGFEADQRNYAAAAQMLFALNMPRIRLLTNNPDKVSQLKDFGIDIVEVIPTKVFLKSQNYDYLLAKQRITGHSISF